MGLSGSKVVAALELRSNVGTVLGKAADDLGLFEKAIEITARKLQKIGLDLTTQVSLPIGGAGAVLANAAVQWETAFSQVRKTVNGLTDDVTRKLTPAGVQMEQTLRRMATTMPQSSDKIAAVASIAGQMGIATENIAGFTTTMIQLGDATDLSAEQAASALGTIATITKMNERDFDRLGAVVNRLETDFNSTADQIAEMGKRLAAAGHVAGLSEAEILSFASTLASVGVNAEAGGTAFSKVFQSVFEAVKTGNDNLSLFASTAGMTVDQFTAKFGEKGGAAAVIDQFVKGLGRINEAGGNVFEVLGDVEFKDAQLKNAILALSGAGDQLTKQLAAGHDEWNKHSSLLKEVQIRYETVAARATMFWNRVTYLAQSLGSVLLPALSLTIQFLSALLVPLMKVGELIALLPYPIKLLIGGFILWVGLLGPVVLGLSTLVLWILKASGTIATFRNIVSMMTGDFRNLTGFSGTVVKGLDKLTVWALEYIGVNGGLIKGLELLYGKLVQAAKGLLGMEMASKAATAASEAHAAAVEAEVIITSIPTGGRGAIRSASRMLPGEVEVMKSAGSGATAAATRAGSSFASAAQRVTATVTGAGEAAGASVRQWLSFSGVLTGLRVVFGWLVKGIIGVGEQFVWLGGKLLTVGKFILQVVGWQRLLIAAFTWLVFQIPGVSGVVSDLFAIIKDIAILGFQFWVDVMRQAIVMVGSTWNAFKGWLGNMLGSLPGAQIVIKFWKDLTQSIHDYRAALDNQVENGPRFSTDTNMPDVPGIPAALTGGPKRANQFSPGDTQAHSTIALMLLAQENEDAVKAVAKLNDETVRYIETGHLAHKSTDEMSKVVQKYGLSETEAGAAIEMITGRLDKKKQKEEEAIRKTEAHIAKIKELHETMNGMAAVKAGAELAEAMKGVNVAGMDPEQKATVNATAKAAMKGITQQGDVAKQSKAMQDLYAQMVILESKTVDLKTGIHQVWVTGADGLKYMTWVGKDAEAMFESLRVSNRDMAEEAAKLNDEKAWAGFAEMSAAAAENRDAVVALRVETAELWAAANNTGPDTLQKKLAAISYEYDKQRKAVDTLHLKAEGGTQLIIALTEKERAARAEATAEYVKTLPVTRQMISLQREQAMAAIRDQIANARAYGLTAEAVEQLKLKLKQLKLEGRQALGAEIMKWADGFSQVGSAFSDFATYFDGKMGKLLAKAGEFAQEIGQIGKGIAQMASGDYIGGAINMIKGALDLFDVGETEYEKQAKAAGKSFQDLRGELLDTYGSYDRLRQIAERTNTEIDIEFDPNGDAFQQLDQLEKQAKALEAAIAKVKAGLEMFASGAKTRIDAFASAFKVIGTDGKATDKNSLAAGLAKLGGTRTQVEAEYQRLGTYAGASFLQTLREEGMAKAMEVAGPLFETITTLGDEVGLGLHGAAKAMADFFKVAKDNADIMQALDGIQQMIQGASDAAFLNSEMFSAFGEDVSLQFQRLQERGVDAGTAMALMQPTLQALWEAQKKYGYATDETTQKLIDEAVAAGIVGENQRDVNQQILEVLKAIAGVMGAEIPNAMGEMASAAEREAARMKTALDDATRDRNVNVDVNYNDPGYNGGYNGSDGSGDGQDPNMQAMGGFVRSLNYCATGGFIRPLLRAGGGGIDWTPRGTDTVPTMLTPGELVLNVAQQRNVAGALGSDPKALATAIASALKEGGIGGGEAGVVVLKSNGSASDQFNSVLDSLPRALRQNKNGLRTALREALGIDA